MGLEKTRGAVVLRRNGGYNWEMQFLWILNKGSFFYHSLAVFGYFFDFFLSKGS